MAGSERRLADLANAPWCRIGSKHRSIRGFAAHPAWWERPSLPRWCGFSDLRDACEFAERTHWIVRSRGGPGAQLGGAKRSHRGSIDGCSPFSRPPQGDALSGCTTAPAQTEPISIRFCPKRARPFGRRQRGRDLRVMSGAERSVANAAVTNEPIGAVRCKIGMGFPCSRRACSAFVRGRRAEQARRLHEKGTSGAVNFCEASELTNEPNAKIGKG